MADDAGIGIDADDRDRLISALTTEHFVLQSAASATISESSSRSSLYLLSLSSSLVALTFAAQTRDAFSAFAAAILPTLFVLGCFTVVRLVDTSIENVSCLRAIARIRRSYVALIPGGDRYFPSSGSDTTDAEAMLAFRSERSSLLFTMASLIGVVNAVLGGTAIGLLVEGVFGAARAVAVGVAVFSAGVFVLLTVSYERRRFVRAFRPPDETAR